MTASVVLFSGGDEPITHRKELTLNAARRRTRVVKAFRRLLLAVMGALALAVGAYVALGARTPAIEIEPDVASGQDRMINPRYTGYDANGTPFEITATSAQRQRAGSDVMELDAPRLDLTGQSTPSSIVEAVRGVYDQEARTLTLRGGVNFRTGDGYEFVSENAVVHVDDGRVVGDRPVRGEGQAGSIIANAFEIYDNGGAVAFQGEVEATIHPEESRGVVTVPNAPAPRDDEGSDVAAGISPEGGPIHITADSTEFVTSENVNRWFGGVVVTQGETRLMADQMHIYFDEEEEDGGARVINRIEAEGSVAYVTPGETARGDEGAYFARAERIILTGDVVLVRGASRATGAEFVVDLQTGESTLSQRSAGGATSPERVRGLLSAEDLDTMRRESETSGPAPDQPGPQQSDPERADPDQTETP